MDPPRTLLRINRIKRIGTIGTIGMKWDMAGSSDPRFLALEAGMTVVRQANSLKLTSLQYARKFKATLLLLHP